MRRLLIPGIVLLGVILRALLLTSALGIRPLNDEVEYLDMAFGLQRTGVFHGPWAPGYSWLLTKLMQVSGSHSLDSIKWTQVLVFSPAIGLAVMSIARHVFDRRAQLIAGLCWALYLPLAAFSHLYWPETLFLAILLPAILLVLKGLDEMSTRAPAYFASAGLLLGLGALTKESATFLPLILGGALVLRSRFEKKAITNAVLMLLASAVVVAPWTMRNWETYDRFELIGTTMGVNFHVGMNAKYKNHDYSKEVLASAYSPTHWVRRHFMAAQARGWKKPHLPNKVDESRESVRRGVAFMAERPGYLLRSRIRKIADMVTPSSFLVRHQHRGLYHGWMADPWAGRAITTISLTSVLALFLVSAAAICYVPRWGNSGWVLFMIIGYVTATCLLVSMSRFRMPMVPVLVVIASGLLSDLTVVRQASRMRHTAFSVAVAALIGLWSLNYAGVMAMARSIWSN